MTSNSIKCTFINGSNCTPRVTCAAYDVTAPSLSSDKKSRCDALLDVDGTTHCTYLWGNKCVKLAACSSYDGATTPELGPKAGSEDA